MSWIQNRSKGAYLFISTRRDPETSSVTLKSEIGTNAVVGPGHFRFVDDSHFKKNKPVYIAVVLKHGKGGKPVEWISQEIGPGESWIFDGHKICKPVRKSKADIETAHGA